MSGRLLLYDEEARAALKQGIDILASAVKVTLGPCGRNVAYTKGYGRPAITRDGVTVAKEIGLSDPKQEAGVQLLMEAATKTNDTAGDGTTTATVLAQLLVHEGIRAVVAGANPVLLARGLAVATAAVIEAIKQAAVPADNAEVLTQVASIAATDAEMGRIVAGALQRVGRDGIVTVEDGRSLVTEVEYMEGMKLDKGYLNTSFVTDYSRMEAVLEDPYILITDKPIRTVGEILPALGAVASSDRRELFIVAESIEGDALATLLVNKKEGNMTVVAIRTPEVGDRRRDVLHDLAILTGGRLVSDETGIQLENVQFDDLGDCTRVVARQDETILIGGQGDPAAIAARIAHLRRQIPLTDYFYDRDKMKERLARLSSGAAIIRPGAASDVEMQEKKLRYDDALAAARAARDEGIVPGGGVAYLNAIRVLDTLALQGDAAIAGEMLRRALEAPIRQIVENGGHDGSVIVAGVREQQAAHESQRWGFDVAQRCYVDMIAAGIVDPARVTRLALENASSVAGMILTTSAMVTDWVSAL